MWFPIYYFLKKCFLGQIHKNGFSLEFFFSFFFFVVLVVLIFFFPFAVADLFDGL